MKDKKKEIEEALKKYGIVKINEAKGDVYISLYGFVELVDENGKYFIQSIVDNRFEVEVK